MKLVNTKKHIVLGVALVSALAIAGLQNASAGPWGFPPCGECDGSGYQRQQLDEKTIEARNAFLSETAELRKEIAIKKAEKRAIMLNDNPDAKRVSVLTGEIFDLHEKLQNKAQEKGIEKIGYGRGPGRGCGGPGSRGF